MAYDEISEEVIGAAPSGDAGAMDSTGGYDGPGASSGRQAGETSPLSDGSFSIGSDVWPGLSKAIEEAGEFLQVAGKVIATHGASDHWDGSDLRERFKEEAADLLAALRFVLGESFSPVERVAVEKRAEVKERLFCEWQDAQQTGRSGDPVDG